MLLQPIAPDSAEVMIALGLSGLGLALGDSALFTPCINSVRKTPLYPMRGTTLNRIVSSSLS